MDGLHRLRGVWGYGRAGCAGLGGLGLLLAAQPFQSVQAAGASESAEVLEEVVVTARRREESLQDAPVAVTAVTGDMLERMLITTTTDLDKIVPNLQFHSYGTLTGNNSAAQVFIRGIGQTDATPAVDPGVGIYIDDVYMGRAVGGAMEFRDVANVQVLRGPQGTLFGRNTVGGAVLVTTNGPGEGAGALLRATVGEDDLMELFGAADLLDGEKWSARAAAGIRKRDGYVTRISDGADLGDEDMVTGQVALRWKPTDNLAFTLRGDYTDEDENGSPFVFRAMNEAQLFVGVASILAECPNILDGLPPPTLVGPQADPRCGNDAQALGPFTNGGTAPASSSTRNRGLSLVATWDYSDVLSFKSVTAGRKLDWDGSRDADNTPLLVLHTSYDSATEQFSQELQALVDSERIDGVFGLYFFDEDSSDRVIVDLSNPGTSYDTQRVALGSSAWAAFTDWTLKITQGLSATAGIRYTDETKDLQGTLFNVSPATAPEPAAPTTLCPFNGPPPSQTGCLFLSTGKFSRDFSATTTSASIQYRWNEKAMTYVSWSEGFKSGGYNQRYNAAPPGNEPISFGSETAQTIEVGAKLNPLPSLRVNAALFSTTYDDIQMTYRLGVVPLLFNAGKASIDGGELEVTFAPGRGFLFDASVGYLDSGFDSISQPPPVGSVPLTATATLSSRLPFTPEWTTHAGASYALRIADDWTLTPRVDVSYTAEQFFDAANSTEIAQNGGVTVWNGSIALESTRWRFSLNGNNLGDKLYPLAGTSSMTTSAGYAEIINARPRSLSLTAQYTF